MNFTGAATLLFAILAPGLSSSSSVETPPEDSFVAPQTTQVSNENLIGDPVSKRVLQTLNATVEGQAACPAGTEIDSGRRLQGPTGVIIDNGLIKLGITQEGALNVPGTIPDKSGTVTRVGLRYIFPDGSGESESTSYGCTCEGWGAGADGESVFFNTANSNSPPGSYTFEGSTSTSSTFVTTVSTASKLRVTHDYHPSPDTANLYEVTVTLDNISGATISDLRYRRNMDWDIYPTMFSECVTIQPDPAIATDSLIAATTNGFTSSDPYVTLTGVPAPVTDLGPSDHGAAFDFQFGALNAGDSFVFNTYYGATESQSEAEATLGSVSAQAYSFGKPSGPTGLCDVDTPNVFIFGFAGVGGGALFSGAPSVSPSEGPSLSLGPSLGPSISTAPSTSSSPTVATAKITGTVFLDLNQDGLQGTSPSEGGLSGQTIELHCLRNGILVKEATTTSATDGAYEFDGIVPGKCRIKVLRPLNYEFSPVVLGGNKVGKDGWSPEYDLSSTRDVNVLVGMYQTTLEADCNPLHCTNKVIDPILGYHDCGWGIWNDCTCQCVCDPGVCLSANQKCYDGCLTHLDHNPYGGCSPGVDCPWYRSKTGEAHCESSANFAGIHALRETAELCCKQHFSQINLATCVQNSAADVAAEEEKVLQDLARTKYFYPDWTGKKNCVFSSDYEDWMMGPNEEYYLFESDIQCCGNWYPTKSDCPYIGEITPKQVDYKPYASEGYFYPHLAASNCRFGRNYPMWMKFSPKHYLYTSAEDCCSEWYPGAGGNCPLTEDDGVQEGYFWLVDEAFFPNWKGGGCGHGNDWPEWMADPTQAESHLFKTAKDCCDFWFPSGSTNCQDTIVYSSIGKQIGGPANYNGGTWYPSLNGKYQCLMGNPPEWMKADGYSDEYVFDSHAECCQAHYCADIRGVVQSGNSLGGSVQPGHYPQH